MEGKYLITTDGWFYAPDGKTYRAVWGDVCVMSDSILGVTTNRNSSNWFLRIGSEENHVIVAGCQVHYAVRSENKPNSETVIDHVFDAANGCKIFDRPSHIYIAE